MVELKIFDSGSLGRLVEVLSKNGYKVSSYVVWKNGKVGEIDHFIVHIRGLDCGN